jgi:glutamate dehydrogenase/leucine dehydrogenase
MGYYWSFNEVAKKMEEHIVRGFNDTYAYSKKHGIDMRRAAMVLAVDRVVEAFNLKGIWP